MGAVVLFEGAPEPVGGAHTEAAGGPESLKRLSVQFRGMGVLGEEITVTGSVTELTDDGTLVVPPGGGFGDASERRSEQNPSASNRNERGVP